MREVARIMVVDDEPANLGVIEDTLEDDFDVYCVTSGEECLDKISEVMPDLILMDILMPGLNGYDVCERLKKNEKTRHIPVIFVSALGDVESRLKAYNLKAFDYITKPFNLDELMSKVKVYVDAKVKHDKLIEEIRNVTDVVHTTMNMSSESGIVSHFIENSFLANSYQEIADILFDSLSTFGLNAAFQVHLEGEVMDFNPEGIFKPLESELITVVKSKGRIFNYDSRLFINYTNSSILVKNLPLNDPEKCGRLREHLAVIGSAADARVVALNTQIKLEKHLNIQEIIKAISVTVDKLQQRYACDRLQTLNITQMMGQNIEERLLYLGLDEDQESALLDLVDDSTQKLISIFNNENMVTENFADLMALVKKIDSRPH